MEKLGIDPMVMLFQIINFGILVYLLNKFLYKPVLSAIKAKRKELEDIEQQKEELAKQKEDIVREREDIVKKAQSERVELLRDAKAEAAKAKKDALEMAEKEAKKIIEKTKKDIVAEKKKIESDFNKRVIDTSLAIAEKVVGQKADRDLLGRIKNTLYKS